MNIDDVSMQRLLTAAEAVMENRDRAKEWLSEPLATFNGRSALDLVQAGQLDDVLKYLSSIESGFVG